MLDQTFFEKKAQRQFQEFLRDCQIQDPRGKRVLEIGFKNGLFLNECKKAGMIAVGTEILEEFCKEVREKFDGLELVLYTGGSIRLPDASFDFVVSFQVLEHIEMTDGETLNSFFADTLRLLKPGGMMYHRCPNYHSFYEGHYGIFWLPFLNKRTGSWYLRVRGKDPHELQDQVTLVTPQRILAALKPHLSSVEVVSLGAREFMNYFRPDQVARVKAASVRTLLRVCIWFRLDRLLGSLIARTQTHYPLVVIVRKKETA